MGFESKVKVTQQRFDDLSKHYDSQIQQISRSAAHESVIEAYPNLDQEPFVILAQERSSTLQKKPGEKWVNIYLTGEAVNKSIISKTKLEQIIVELRNSGFGPIVGLISFGGRMEGLLERASPGSYNESGVFYFRPISKPTQPRLPLLRPNTFSSRQVLRNCLCQSGLKNFVRTRLDLLVRDGKLDAQIFISAK
jgi:hypothetical protein